MTTQIHDSTTCTAGKFAQPCEMCQFAQNARQAVSGLFGDKEGEKIDSSPTSASGITISAPDFEREWNAAPRSMRNYVEREIAEYFYLCGLRAGMRVEFENTNQTLRSLIGKLSQ